jgi:hypothetical protein
VTPRIVLADAAGDQEVISVTATDASCAWTTSSTLSWLTFDATGRTGTAQVTLRVARNDSTLLRLGVVTVAGAPIEVTQAGAPLLEPQDIEGAVSDLDGTCLGLTFRVADRLVRTSLLTAFNGGRCSDIRNGTVVEVRGLPQVDGSLLASRVRIR